MSVKFATFDAPAKAEGHPSECTAVVSGTVQSDSPSSVTVTTSGGTTKGIATVNNASIHFDSHSHDYSTKQGCHQNSSHDLDPDSGQDSSSLTINGSPVYIVKNGVTTDPGSGGSVNITGAGNNNSVTET